MINNTANYIHGEIGLTMDPVTVPSDFLGFHFHAYPAAITTTGHQPSAAPTYQFGATRSLSVDVAGWGHIQPSQGTFNWTGMDLYMSTFGDKPVLYSLCRTPTWAASATDATYRDLSWYLGGAAMPTNMQYVTDFLTALYNRYPGKIKYIEPWNEPNYDNNHTGFWWGTEQDLLLLSKTVYDVTKAVSPTTKVLTPAFALPTLSSSCMNQLNSFMNTTHVASGKKGSQICDAIAVHTYNTTFSDTPVTRDFLYSAMAYQKYNSLQQTTGYSMSNTWGKDVYITEWGVGAFPNESHLVKFNALPGNERATIVWRTLAYAALKKVKAYYIYSHDNSLAGNYTNTQWGQLDTYLCDMITDFHTNVCGKTITGAKIFTDGKLQLIMSDGKTYTR